MRSILGRARVTQTVRPRLSRGGSLAAGTSGRPACRQASNPPASDLGRHALVAEPGGSTLAQLLPPLADGDRRAARESRGPFRCRVMRAAHRARDQAGIGREVLLGADVDDRRALRRADQAGELVDGDGGDRRHGCVLRCVVGRDSSACRLVGRSLPHGGINRRAPAAVNSRWWRSSQTQPSRAGTTTV